MVLLRTVLLILLSISLFFSVSAWQAQVGMKRGFIFLQMKKYEHAVLALNVDAYEPRILMLKIAAGDGLNLPTHAAAYELISQLPYNSFGYLTLIDLHHRVGEYDRAAKWARLGGITYKGGADGTGEVR